MKPKGRPPLPAVVECPHTDRKRGPGTGLCQSCYQLRWSQLNREKCRLANARYRDKNPEEYKRSKKAYRERNREKLRATDRQKRRRQNGAEATIELRSGVCPICLVDREKLFLDHDHQSGLTRGWVCNRCNAGLGSLGDTVEGVKRALAYLEAFYAKPTGH